MTPTPNRESAEDDLADFDAFFAEENQARFGSTLRLYGREYVLPTSLPLLFTTQMERVRNSNNTDDIRRVLAVLFGRDALDEWADKGMSDRQFAIVLLWSANNAHRPGCMTIAEAAALHDEREAAQAAAGGEGGKALSPSTPTGTKTPPRSGASS